MLCRKDNPSVLLMHSKAWTMTGGSLVLQKQHFWTARATPRYVHTATQTHTLPPPSPSQLYHAVLTGPLQKTQWIKEKTEEEKWSLLSGRGLTTKHWRELPAGYTYFRSLNEAVKIVSKHRHVIMWTYKVDVRHRHLPIQWVVAAGHRQLIARRTWCLLRHLGAWRLGRWRGRGEVVRGGGLRRCRADGSKCWGGREGGDVSSWTTDWRRRSGRLSCCRRGERFGGWTDGWSECGGGLASWLNRGGGRRHKGRRKSGRGMCQRWVNSGRGGWSDDMGLMIRWQLARGGHFCQLCELCALWDFTVWNKTKNTVEILLHRQLWTFSLYGITVCVPELHLHCYGVLLFPMNLNLLWPESAQKNAACDISRRVCVLTEYYHYGDIIEYSWYYSHLVRLGECICLL